MNAHYLVVEYPGYGISNGLPSEELYDEVAFTVYKFVINELKVPPSKVVLIGRSIGTGSIPCIIPCSLAHYYLTYRYSC